MAIEMWAGKAHHKSLKKNKMRDADNWIRDALAFDC